MTRTMLVALCLLTAAPAWAAPDQFGRLRRAVEAVDKFRDVQVTDEEEQQLGEAVSARVRERYGVVQDQAVHRYVGLVGAVLAEASDRAKLPWRFIVLDTDGVNAFAAPGGFVHITRGALGLIDNEAELADVLAHEIIHVTEKHTIKAIQKGKMIQMGADETLSNSPELFNRMVDQTTELVLAGFGRAEEKEADEKGLQLASKVGYAPQGLNAFLRRLEARNQGSEQRQGLFASHPEMQERLEANEKTIRDKRLRGMATLAERFHAAISYETPPLAKIAVVEAGSAGLAGGGEAESSESKTEGDDEKAEPKKRGFGLSALVRPGGDEQRSTEVTGSGASRGVDTERNAKGGDNPAPVTVTITPADIAQFKKDGNLG